MLTTKHTSQYCFEIMWCVHTKHRSIVPNMDNPLKWLAVVIFIIIVRQTSDKTDEL